MKKLLIYFLVFAFPFAVCAQKTSGSSKSKTIKELHYFERSESVVPETSIYYTKEGRLLKIIWISEGMHIDEYYVETLTFNSAGKIVSARRNDAYGTDPLVMGASGKFSSWRTWRYSGDTMAIETDSTWEEEKLLRVSQTISTVHWKKYPAPKPKPLLWQDSLCFKTVRTTGTRFTFSDDGKIEKAEPFFKTDKLENYMENGKLHAHEYNDQLYQNQLYVRDFNGTYTVNPRFDTVTEITRKDYYKTGETGITLHTDSIFSLSEYHFETTRAATGKILWTHEKWIFLGVTHDFGNKQPDEVFGFPRDDYSLTNYFEQWEFNSGDPAALTIEGYKQPQYAKTRKQIVYW